MHMRVTLKTLSSRLVGITNIFISVTVGAQTNVKLMFY